MFVALINLTSHPEGRLKTGIKVFRRPFCLIMPICFKRAGTGLWKLGLDRNIAAFPQKLTAKRLHGKIPPVCRLSEFFRRPFTLFKRNPHVFAKHH
ncbi:hypothetical protein HMPREF9418_0457 [Neisseria macacae ATCC 33926]|uniref:Uncharacterized protein n=1 Tax=Neisseria macacae ATCC 33926 TaxID=997348 RepID=A0AA36XLJ5_9NEIS|nr:hypothetical protein HMPREF9418_0457 [Neisseria macacae ATCC 33926]